MERDMEFPSAGAVVPVMSVVSVGSRPPIAGAGR